MSACQYCQNEFEDAALLEDHEPWCGMNPSQQEKKRKLGELEITKKTIVLKEGKPERMYWEHSRLGVSEINIGEVLERWELLYPNDKPKWFWPAFLQERGFTRIINKESEVLPPGTETH